jgi:hypothetical protein
LQFKENRFEATFFLQKMTMGYFFSFKLTKIKWVRISKKTVYFVTKVVLTYCEKINVLVIKKKLLKLEAEGREFAKFLRSLEQFVQTVKSQDNFWL